MLTCSHTHKSTLQYFQYNLRVTASTRILLRFHNMFCIHSSCSRVLARTTAHYIPPTFCLASIRTFCANTPPPPTRSFSHCFYTHTPLLPTHSTSRHLHAYSTAFSTCTHISHLYHTSYYSRQSTFQSLVSEVRHTLHIFSVMHQFQSPPSLYILQPRILIRTATTSALSTFILDIISTGKFSYHSQQVHNIPSTVTAST